MPGSSLAVLGPADRSVGSSTGPSGRMSWRATGPAWPPQAGARNPGGGEARVIADNTLGGGNRTADYTAVPGVVFVNLEIAAVGHTAAQARNRGIDRYAVADSWSREATPVPSRCGARGPPGPM